ncbi:hypothetical protein DFP72DRAFT_1053964 [Ephemerocybe angulata]|uniref:Uncharacterized protein n=1 Tax=Ephemerocybe angulata TaxID=980116 RepID=A0A8H6LUC2_9AGAR|nr:hypothetical protein DFP72DRAFT_1053964 [Tulosesus angulatus]
MESLYKATKLLPLSGLPQARNLRSPATRAAHRSLVSASSSASTSLSVNRRGEGVEGGGYEDPTQSERGGECLDARFHVLPVSSKSGPSAQPSALLPTSRSTTTGWVASLTDPRLSVHVHLEHPTCDLATCAGQTSCHEKSGGTGGGRRDEWVAADVEDHGSLSWGGRSWGVYLSSPRGRWVQVQMKQGRPWTPTPTPTRILEREIDGIAYVKLERQRRRLCFYELDTGIDDTEDDAMLLHHSVDLDSELSSTLTSTLAPFADWRGEVFTAKWGAKRRRGGGRWERLGWGRGRWATGRQDADVKDIEHGKGREVLLKGHRRLSPAFTTDACADVSVESTWRGTVFVGLGQGRLLEDRGRGYVRGLGPGWSWEASSHALCTVQPSVGALASADLVQGGVRFRAGRAWMAKFGWVIHGGEVAEERRNGETGVVGVQTGDADVARFVLYLTSRRCGGAYCSDTVLSPVHRIKCAFAILVNARARTAMKDMRSTEKRECKQQTYQLKMRAVAECCRPAPK